MAGFFDFQRRENNRIRKELGLPPIEYPQQAEPEPALVPEPDAVKEAARREAERLRKKRGFRSTILTGPLGLSQGGGSVLTQTLG